MTNEKTHILEQLFALERRGIKPGLERTFQLLDQIGNPQSEYPIVHVAGTNGKGSVVSIIASVLMTAGYSVGIYTSPHIFNFNERIKIGNSMISDDDLVLLAKDLIEKSEAIGATFFEITSAMAFKYFADKKVDIAIIETGLGGRFDSTNVVNPILSIITSIDLEHQDYLGNTIEEIASEKAGIIKQNIPVIIGENKANALEIIINKAKEMNAEFYTLSSGEVSFVKYKDNLHGELNIQSYFANYQAISSPLIGTHQLANHLTAVNALERIRRRFPFADNDVKIGIEKLKENTGLSNRIELINTKPITIIDVAHNPSAIVMLCKTIGDAFPNKKFNVVFGVMSDKNIEQMLFELRKICKEIIITVPKTKRSASAELIEGLAKAQNFEKIAIIEDANEAYLYAKSQSFPFIVAGSFFLIADIKELEKR